MQLKDDFDRLTSTLCRMQINNTHPWISHLTNIDRPAGHPEGSTFSHKAFHITWALVPIDFNKDYDFNQWQELYQKHKAGPEITINPFLDDQTKANFQKILDNIRAHAPSERERYEQFLKAQKHIREEPHVRLDLPAQLRQFDGIRPARAPPPKDPTSPPVTIAIYEGDRLVAYGSGGVSALSEFAIRDGVSDLFRNWDRFAIHEMNKQLQEGLKEIGENFRVLTQQDGLNMTAFEALEQFRSH